MIDPRAAEPADDDDAVRAQPERRRDRQLGIGLVLVATGALERDAGRLERGDLGLGQRIAVADPAVDRDAERSGQPRATVGGDDQADRRIPARPVASSSSRVGRSPSARIRASMPAMLPRRTRPRGPMLDSGPCPSAPIHPAVQRVLDAAARKGVTLEVTVFDESTHTAVEAAAAVGADLGQIVKSLVFVVPIAGGLEPILCLVAGHNRVDVARLAAVTGAPDIRRATAREARELTGFSIGGIPPIGHDPTDPGDHGSGPRSLPGGLGGGRPADDGLPDPAGDAAHPVQRDRRADRRGTAPGRGRGRCRGCRAGPAPSSGGPAAIRLARPAPVSTPDPRPTSRPGREPRNATITYPGGLRARWRWGGSGSAPEVFALSEAGGELIDLGPRVAADPTRCAAPSCVSRDRAGPGRPGSPRSSTTSRGRSTGTAPACSSSPTGSTPTASRRRPATARWEHRSATPILALLGSPRLAHVMVQAEIETFAIEPDGSVAWRVAHSEVVTAAELIGGRLVLTGFGGQVTSLDPATGRSAS